MRALCLLLIVLLLPEAALGQAAPRLLPSLSLEYTPAPLVAVPDGEDRIEPLRLGAPAPFQGQLFDPSTSVRWMNYLEQARFRLREDVLLERRVCNASMDYYERRISLEQGARASIEKDLRARLLEQEKVNADLQKDALNPSVWKSPVFWLLAGVLTTSVVFGVSAYSLNQVR